MEHPRASDYTLPSNVVFASGASTASVILNVVDDSDFEVDETVIVELGVLPPGIKSDLKIL